MVQLADFSQWLNNNTKLSESSVYKYSRAVLTISREMKESGVIRKDLLDMNLCELDIAVNLIMVLPDFVAKDKKGNKMYSNSLKHYRCFLYAYGDDVETVSMMEHRIMNDVSISVTQRESIVKSRVGQGIFKSRILNKFNGKCLITGISIEKCLIASHIKPWAVCTNEERLSENNGLLLSATYDRLFDSGLISFKENGNIIISGTIDDYNREKLYLSNDLKITLPDDFELKCNLEYHRDVLLIR